MSYSENVHAVALKRISALPLLPSVNMQTTGKIIIKTNTMLSYKLGKEDAVSTFEAKEFPTSQGNITTKPEV